MTARAHGDGEAVNHDCGVKGDQEEAADETEFFRIHGEDKVGLHFGQKPQMTLGSLQKSLAENTSGPERDFRLQDVITGSQGIALW